jgi:hypothetical protein
VGVVGACVRVCVCGVGLGDVPVPVAGCAHAYDRPPRVHGKPLQDTKLGMVGMKH